MQDAQSPDYREASLTSERRISRRFPVKPVEYVEVGDHNGGIILDISEEGMAVSTAQSLNASRTWRFRFQLPRTRETIDTLGQISWIGESKKRAGVRFVELAAPAREHLLKWIDEQNGRALAAMAAKENRPSNGESEESQGREDQPAEPPAASSNKVSKITFSQPMRAPRPSDDLTSLRHKDEAADLEEARAERRAQVRKSPNTALYLQLDDGNAGLIENLSKTGLLFRAAKSLQRDEVIAAFQIPGTENTIETPISIVWSSASKKKVGARFTALPEEAKQQIGSWIDPNTASRKPTPRSGGSAALRSVYRSGFAQVPDGASPQAISERNDSKPAATKTPIAAGDSAFTKVSQNAARTSPVEPATSIDPQGHSGEESQSPQLSTHAALRSTFHAAPSQLFETVDLPADQDLEGYAPVKSSWSVWKFLAATVILCSVCFGLGMLYSQKDRILSRAAIAVRPHATENAAQESSPVARSEEPDPASAVSKPHNASAEKNDAGTAANAQDLPITPHERNTALLNSTISNAAKEGSAAENRPSSTSVDLPVKRTTGRDATNTNLKPSSAPIPDGSIAASAPANSRRGSATDAYSRVAKSVSSAAKPATVTHPTTEQTTPSAQAPDANSALAPAPASNSPGTVEPAQAPLGTVTHFSRFRSIRNGEGASGSGNGTLQLGPVLSSPVPDYPAEARRKQIQGVVELLAIVGADGNVETVQFIKGPAELADLALDAARQWRYGSTVLDGRPVATEQSIYFTFKIAK